MAPLWCNVCYLHSGPAADKLRQCVFNKRLLKLKHTLFHRTVRQKISWIDTSFEKIGQYLHILHWVAKMKCKLHTIISWLNSTKFPPIWLPSCLSVRSHNIPYLTPPCTLLILTAAKNTHTPPPSACLTSHGDAMTTRDPVGQFARWWSDDPIDCGWSGIALVRGALVVTPDCQLVYDLCRKPTEASTWQVGISLAESKAKQKPSWAMCGDCRHLGENQKKLASFWWPLT